MKKGKPLIIHMHSVNFLWISAGHLNTVCCGHKWSGSEACFEETEDQLSPHHFENTGSTSLFYVECSYLVIIKSKDCRIVDIKHFTVQNILALLMCPFPRVVFSKASPDSDFVPKRLHKLQASGIGKITRIWLKFTTCHLLKSWNACVKYYEIWWEIELENNAWP